LTAHGGSLYSLRMDDELAALEQKLDEFLALCHSLRAENMELRTRLAGMEGEKHRLNQKVDAATARLEALMEKLPDSV